jgi:hypothetical protein
MNEEPKTHNDPTDAAPVAWLEAGLLLAIAGGIVWLVLAVLL